MAFVNISLLAGMVLITIPIALHLIMRQRAKSLVFPALQFLQERRETNRRQLKMRHWLLLVLRCALVAILALLLAQPSVGSSLFGDVLLIGGIALLLLFVLALAATSAFLRRGPLLTGALGIMVVGLLASLLVVVAEAARERDGTPIGDCQNPVMAFLVFDTAPRMGYRHQNQTRLEQARQTAEWLIKKFPTDSQIAVADAAVPHFVFLDDRNAVKRSLARLQITNVTTPLLEIVLRGFDALRQHTNIRKELYIFTDLAAAEWETDIAKQIRDMVPSEKSQVSIFVIDVGVENPHNSSLGKLSLSTESLAPQSPFVLQTKLTHLGNPSERGIELFLEAPGAKQPLRVDGSLVRPPARRADRKLFNVTTETSHQVQFQLHFTEFGIHHGWIKLLGSDGLPADDFRYFSVEVQPRWSILLVVGPHAHGRFLSEALAPHDFPSRFECRTVTVDELQQLQDLTSYAAICLVDPSPLPQSTWRKLSDYVERGHGLGLFLGRNAQPVQEFNSPAARMLLPATLKPIVMRRPQGDLSLAPRNENHPLLATFRSVETAVPWHDFPVFRHWLIDETDIAGQVVLAFSNNRAALVERQVGRGRVLMMTTPLSDSATRPEMWNRLPSGLGPWPFVILANESVGYLVGKRNRRINFEAGETVVWSRNTASESNRYVLFTPDGNWHDLHAAVEELRIALTNEPGTYRLVSPDGSAQGAFSVNLAANSTELRRTNSKHLDDLFGRDAYTVVRTHNEIVRKQSETRTGKEFFPYVGLLLVIVLGVEQLLANRFYDASVEPAHD